MTAWDDENRWYARLMKLAHDLAMQGRGQEAQDIRVAATHARNALRARVAELEKDAARWKLLTRVASLGFDDAPLWKAVIRLPVFDNGDQTITALVDRIAIAERAADK